MTNRYNPNRSKEVRSPRSTGWECAKFTASAVEKSDDGLFRWDTTDHSGMNKALINMPSMGFIDTIKYMLTYETVFILDDIGYGVDIFFSKGTGVDPDLLAMCQRYATPGQV